MKKYVFAALIVLLAAGGACAAQSDGPSLGDLARKHRQEEKNVAKVKVLTNEDVATSTPSAQAQSEPAVGASTATPAASTAAAAKSPGKASDTGKGPAAASSAATKDTPEVAELKQKLSSYKQQQEGWKQSVKKNEDLLANETSDFRRQMYQDALQGDKQNVQVMQDKIDQAQADLNKAEKASSQNH